MLIAADAVGATVHEAGLLRSEFDEQRDSVSLRLDGLSNEITVLCCERDALSARAGEAASLLAAAHTQRDALSGSLTDAVARRDAVLAEFASLCEERDALCGERDAVYAKAGEEAARAEAAEAAEAGLRAKVSPEHNQDAALSTSEESATCVVLLRVSGCGRLPCVCPLQAALCVLSPVCACVALHNVQRNVRCAAQRSPNVRCAAHRSPNVRCAALHRGLPTCIALHIGLPTCVALRCT